MAGVVTVPEKTIKNIYNKISAQGKICFLSAVIIGLAAHLYKMTGWLPNWDSLVFRYDAQNMIPLGRWFLPVVCSISSFYDLPWLNGMLAVVYHAFGAVCICRIFDVKKSVTAALIGAVVSTFPAVTSVMMYNYVADGYAFSFLLACAAVVFLTKYKPNYVIAAIMIMLSAGIYQAYVSVTIMLILMYLINKIIFGDADAKDLAKKSAKFLVTGIAGIVLYYIAEKIMLRITGQNALDYQGFSSALSFSGISIQRSLYICTHMFFGYFFDFSKEMNMFAILNCIIFAVMLLLYVVAGVKGKSVFKISKLLLLAVCILLIPIGADILAFVNSSIDYHNLMKMGYWVVYLFFIILYERMDFANPKACSAKAWVILILACGLVYNQIIIANVSYHKLQMAYEKSYGTLVRIADRIEQTENAEKCRDILVVGALSGSEPYSAELPPDMTGTTDGYILRADNEVVGQSVLCSALNDYCGKEYSFVFGERKQKLLKNSAVEEMDYWPKKNSVAVVDNVIVIKLGAESE